MDDAASPRVPPHASQPEDRSEDYLGLPAGQARERAADRGWTRIRELDHWPAMLTMEYIATRINFVVSDEVVTRCWFG